MRVLAGCQRVCIHTFFHSLALACRSDYSIKSGNISQMVFVFIPAPLST
jgi:hypothetical protein